MDIVRLISQTDSICTYKSLFLKDLESRIEMDYANSLIYKYIISNSLFLKDLEEIML